MGNVLPPEFYQRTDVVQIARDLLGKLLTTCVDGQLTSGKIVETEAYAGIDDKACHAHLGRFTNRTKTMYLTGGHAYVYLCYGIHHLFNVVTNVAGMADAVLIRAIEPVAGTDLMAKRRQVQAHEYRLTAGPGVLSKALGIQTCHNGMTLFHDELFIEDIGETIRENEIKIGPRVGVGYAEEDALKPWRFSIRGNPWVSKAK